MIDDILEYLYRPRITLGEQKPIDSLPDEAVYYTGQCDECGGVLMTDGDMFWCEDCDFCEPA